MKMPSLQESKLISEAVKAAEYKHKQLLQKNKEAARALLSAIQIPQVSNVIEKKQNVNPE
jgi:hypothetical protein